MRRTFDNTLIDYTRKANIAEESDTRNLTIPRMANRREHQRLPEASRPVRVTMTADERCQIIHCVSEPRVGERRMAIDDAKEVPGRNAEEADVGLNHVAQDGDIYDVDRVQAELVACRRDATRKPSLSYIALISLAILASPTQQLTLADIYEWMRRRFPYYRHTEAPSWRNSIRHNLSLNECFVKKGRCERRKCSFWTIHPAVVDDFRRYDFRRRHARRRVRMCDIERQDARVYPRDTCRWEPPGSNYVRMNSAHMSTSRLVAMFGAKAVLSPEELAMDAIGETVIRRQHEYNDTHRPQPPYYNNSEHRSNQTNILQILDAPGNLFHRHPVMPICQVPGDFSSETMATSSIII